MIRHIAIAPKNIVPISISPPLYIIIAEKANKIAIMYNTTRAVRF